MERSVYLFDFDGVLVDSMPYWSGTMLDVLKKNKITYPDNIISILKSGVLAKEFDHSFYHHIQTFDEVVADIKHTYDYLDINPDKTRNLYNYENDKYEFSGTISKFKTGTFAEVKEHALRMEQSKYTWDNLCQNGECLYLYMENGEMKYRVR